MKLKTKHFVLAFLLIAGFGGVSAQSTSNVRVGFSCATGQTTVTYDLTASCPTDVILYYSPDTINWLRAQTVSGDLTAQSAGTGKTIIWNNITDYVQYGGFYFKVDAVPNNCGCRVRSTLTSPPYNGWITFMCHNLGANPDMTIQEQMAYTPIPNTAASTDPTVYGDLYQWGRPTDGHEKRTSGTTSTLATTNTPGHSNFITGSSDWRSGGGETARWGDGTQNATVSKAANDPCPDGWRIPTIVEWMSIYGATSGNTWTWRAAGGGTAGYLITPSGSSEPALFLPAAGYRYYYNGSLDYAGAIGYYWSSAVNGMYSYTLNVNASSVNPGFGDRALGFACRCVAE